MSSAKAAIWLDLTASGKEVTYRRNNIGPRIDPYWTPEVTGKGLMLHPIWSLVGIDCAGTILAVLAGSPQNHTDEASLGVSRGLLCQRPHILYRLVLLHPALCQFGLELQQTGLRKTVQL